MRAETKADKKYHCIRLTADEANKLVDCDINTIDQLTRLLVKAGYREEEEKEDV